MGKVNVFGPSSGGNAMIDAVFVDFDDPDQEPVVSEPLPIEHMDGASVQLVSGGARSVVIQDGDNVDESTKTFRLAAGNFTESDVDGTFTLAGSSEGNDDTYTIDTVVNAYTVTTVESPAADEDFDPDAVTVELVQPSPLGDWEFRVSNSFCQGSGPTAPNDGSPWCPIGSQFDPPIAAVADQYVKDTDNTANQFCQAEPLRAAGVQVKFTPTSGRGPISAWFVLGGTR